jgi:predicted RNase H-like HicB family nuclease
MNSRYEVVIAWSREDECFVAEVPQLPGCMADGRSYQEAAANVEIAIREWIETAKQLGRPVPTPESRTRYAEKR